MRTLSTLAVAILGLTASAFCQVTNPDDPPISFCTSAAGGCANTHPNIINSSTGFQMITAQNGQSSGVPWYLLVAVPELAPNTAPTPTISSASFPSLTLAGQFQYNAGDNNDVYTEAGALDGNNKGDGSISAANMSATDQALFGSAPPEWEVFVFVDNTENIGANVAYSFTSNLENGTVLAAIQGKNFQTPYTQAGEISTPGNPNGGPFGNPVPEPTSIVLLGTVGFLALRAFRKKSSAA
jgi:hypothetical protein